MFSMVRFPAVPRELWAVLCCAQIALAITSCGPAAPQPLLGVRLGMTPPQVRDRFDPGSGGSFRSEAMGEDFALVWTPVGSGTVLSARHEFHLGQLVAMRLRVTSDSEIAEGLPIEVTPLSLLARDRVTEGVAITWLARSCPTHTAEVQRRMQSIQ